MAKKKKDGVCRSLLHINLSLCIIKSFLGKLDFASNAILHFVTANFAPK